MQNKKRASQRNQTNTKATYNPKQKRPKPKLRLHKNWGYRNKNWRLNTRPHKEQHIRPQNPNQKPKRQKSQHME